MKKNIPMPAAPAPQAVNQAAPSHAAPPGGPAAQLHASPRMAAQRRQLDGAFGAAQLADKKKKPVQHKADPGAAAPAPALQRKEGAP